MNCPVCGKPVVTGGWPCGWVHGLIGNALIEGAAGPMYRALVPFAEFLATSQHEDADDDLPVYTTERMIDGQVKKSAITMGMLRAARAAIKEARGEQ